MKNGNALSTEPSSLKLRVSLLLIFKSIVIETDSPKSVNTCSDYRKRLSFKKML